VAFRRSLPGSGLLASPALLESKRIPTLDAVRDLDVLALRVCDLAWRAGDAPLRTAHAGGARPRSVEPVVLVSVALGFPLLLCRECDLASDRRGGRTGLAGDCRRAVAHASRSSKPGGI